MKRLALCRSAAAILLLTFGCAGQPSAQIGGPSFPHATEGDAWVEGSVGDPRATVPGAQKTIAGHMPEFRRCFERMDASGKVSLVLVVAGDGRVKHAHAAGPVPRSVIRCVEQTAHRARFAPPLGAEVARLDVPVAIYRQ